MWQDGPHTIVAFLHIISHLLSTSRCLEQPRYCWWNQCSHMGAHGLELKMDPVQPPSCTLTVVLEVGSVWADNLSHLRARIQIYEIMYNPTQYTFPGPSAETLFCSSKINFIIFNQESPSNALPILHIGSTTLLCWPPPKQNAQDSNKARAQIDCTIMPYEMFYYPSKSFAQILR